MGDYYRGDLRIGGDIPQATFYELLALLESNDLKSDEADSLDQAADAAVEAGTPLDLYDDSARDGRFQEIEAFCQAHAISYRVISDPYLSSAGSATWWCPGMSEPESVCHSDGCDMLAITDVLKLINEHSDDTTLRQHLIDSLSACESKSPPALNVIQS